MTDQLPMDPITSAMEADKELARILATSSLMPAAYQGEKGRANTLIAIKLAQQIGADPVMVAQNLHVIHGRPSWSSTFLIACVNKSGGFKTKLRFEERGTFGQPDHGMRAWAIDSDGERINGPWVDMAMAKAEGWSTKKGSKWVTMPELMLRYRSAAFFARTICPELTMGLLTVDESQDIVDMGAAERVSGVQAASTGVDALRAALSGDAPCEPAQDPPADFDDELPESFELDGNPPPVIEGEVEREPGEDDDQ